MYMVLRVFCPESHSNVCFREVHDIPLPIQLENLETPKQIAACRFEARKTIYLSDIYALCWKHRLLVYKVVQDQDSLHNLLRSTIGVAFQLDTNCRTQNVVYLISCGKCGKQYVGETKGPLNIRMNGHRDETKQSRHITCC